VAEEELQQMSYARQRGRMARSNDNVLRFSLAQLLPIFS
jgi:hypothetical protein